MELITVFKTWALVFVGLFTVLTVVDFAGMRGADFPLADFVISTVVAFLGAGLVAAARHGR